MKALVLDHKVSDGVLMYRFKQPADSLAVERLQMKLAKDQTEVDPQMFRWAEENGLDSEAIQIQDWIMRLERGEVERPDFVWSGHYGPQGLALLTYLQDKHGIPGVVDIDDWFEEVPTGNQANLAWIETKKETYRELLRETERITCSTPFLAERFGGVVCPNFLADTERWEGPVRTPWREDECLIACAGGSGRVGDFLRLEKPLRNVLALPNTKLVCFGWVPEWALRDYPVGKVVVVRWIPSKRYPELMRYANPDLFISPMVHDNFNSSKSNLKWLEAGAVGSCFVGERWGEYKRTVEEGVDGFLADGDDEWTDTLLELCVDKGLRTRVAEAGAKKVRADWTWPAVREQWEEGVLGDGVRSRSGDGGPAIHDTAGTD